MAAMVEVVVPLMGLKISEGRYGDGSIPMNYHSWER
jgi:hypothetical protein